MGKLAGDLAGQAAARPSAPSATVLERVQVEPGSAVLYVGCPGLRSLEALARHIGAEGLVTVVEPDAWTAAQARRRVIALRLPNVEILWRTRWPAELEAPVFDVVHVRDPLVVLPWARRRQMLRRVLAATKSGGWIVNRQQRSLLDEAPWTAVRYFVARGLVAVSTEPAQDEGFATGRGGGSFNFLVWGRKPEVSPRRWARRRGSSQHPLLRVAGRASRRAGCEPAR